MNIISQTKNNCVYTTRIVPGLSLNYFTFEQLRNRSVSRLVISIGTPVESFLPISILKRNL